MTAYPRIEDEERDWENILPVRQWLYQTPEQILIKASNGASDFGNKFFSDDSTIDVQFFTNGGCQIKLVTNIKGNKNYKCTLTIAMLQ